MEFKNLPLVFSLLVLCLGLLMTPCNCNTSCEPAEEGTEHQINCTLSSESPSFARYNMDWRMGDEYNTSVVVATCISITDCYIPRPSDVQVSFEGDTSTLTIMTVSRTNAFNVETDWTCNLRAYGKIDVCGPLQVFARPTQVHCEFIGQANKYNGGLTLRCVTEKIYPQAICELQRSYTITGDSWRKSYATVKYNHTVVSEDPVYYNSECTLITDPHDIIFDGPFVKVLMYPDVDGGREYGVESDVWTTALVKVGSGDAIITTTVDPSFKEASISESNDDKDKMILPLALGLGIPLAIMIVVAIVLAVLLCRSKSTNETTRKSKDPPMRISGPLPESYDHVELSNQRQGSVNAGHYYQDVQARGGQSQRSLDSRKQEDLNVESIYVNEADGNTGDSSVYEN